MIDYETYCMIHHFHAAEGLGVRQIARRLFLSRRTVRRWLREERFQQRQEPDRPSKLDPFKARITALLAQHPFSGKQILRILKAEGYTGGKSILNEYLGKVRPRKAEAFLTLRFAAGECAQVDWGEWGSVAVGSTLRRLSFFVMVLCHSRMLYLCFTLGQAMEHFLECHRKAFEYFEGVPHRIMVDNLKCAVLRRLVGQAPVLNGRYRDFAKHYGFEISPCSVGKGNEKGRVESAVGFVKKNLLEGLEIPHFEVLGPLAREWLGREANGRVHGTTKRRPCEMFLEEKGLLRPLPAHPADTGQVRSVRADSRFRVIFETNRYSVPHRLACQRLTMHAYEDELYFYEGQTLVARHPRSYDRHQDFEHPDHAEGLLVERRHARHQSLLTGFLELSGKASQYLEQLRMRTLNERHHLRQIMALCEIHGREKTARALEDCLEMQVFGSAYLANLLEQRGRKLPEAGALHLSRRSDLLEITLPSADLGIYQDRLPADFESSPGDEKPQQGGDEDESGYAVEVPR